MQRWKLTIEYDGRPFCGWQMQGEGLPSVQLAVEQAIHAFCQQHVRLHVAGRTDAGVHAKGQVAHFDLDYGDRPLRGEDLAKALNAHLLPQPVAVVRAEPVASDFEARFHAVNKHYIYRIVNRRAPPAMDKGFVWHVKRALDVAAMQDAAKHLIGHHDFTSFRASECQAKSPIKTLDRLDIESAPYDAFGGVDIRLHFEGRSFLHHMVRNITGSLAMVGEGKWPPEKLAGILQAKDRTRAGPTAPSDGLSLMRIDY